MKTRIVILMAIGLFAFGTRCDADNTCGRCLDSVLSRDMSPRQALSEARHFTNERIREIRSTPNPVPPKGAKVYYVSPTGDDKADGLSPKTAWRTTEHVSRAPLEDGSFVLFERGGIWRVTLDLKGYGPERPFLGYAGGLRAIRGVTYSAYGKGAKPILTTSPFDGADEKRWQKTDAPDVWACAMGRTDVGNIVFNSGECHAIKIVPCTHKDGKVTAQFTGRPFTGYRDLQGDLHFYHDWSTNGIGRGTGTLYLHSRENPGRRFRRIDFGIRHNIITAHGQTGVTIDNLALVCGGAHGIQQGGSRNLRVQNCEFAWIGGGVQGENLFGRPWPVRYGNAVEVGDADGYVVANCYVHDVYDAGLTHQASVVGYWNKTERVVCQRRIRYVNNVIERCNYSIEYFLSNIPEKNPSTMDDFVIAGNLFWDSGSGLSQQRPDRSGDAHIKSWRHCNRARGYVIRDNLFAGGRTQFVQIVSKRRNRDGGGSMPRMENNVFLVKGTAKEASPQAFGVIEQEGESAITECSDARMREGGNRIVEAPANCLFGEIATAGRYLGLEPRFKKAFAFLQRADLAKLKVGRHEIEGDNVYAMIQECDLRDNSANVVSESHRKYIDIQSPISGEETYGYGWLTQANLDSAFNTEKDYALYTKQPLEWRTLKPGEFGVFFPPYGVHAPGCRAGGEPRKIRKLVIKVRMTGETLYNGIRLPGVWPPKIDLTNKGPMQVPYLEEKNVPAVIPIDVGRQLFVDDFLIASEKGVTRVFGKPRKFEGNPVLRPETEIEIHRPGNSVALPKGGGMWWDEARQVFRLWYETGWCYRIAYAESKDGIHWQRPKLDVVPGTNRLLPDMKVDSWSVVYDPETTDETQRWKLQNGPGGHMRPMQLYTSADGIHWVSQGVAGPAGDRTTMFYNPFRRVWSHSLRGGGPWHGGFGGRNRSYFETDEFADAKWTWFKDGSARNATQWQQADSTDVTYANLNRRAQLYSFDAVAYESIMLGFREIHSGPENEVCAKRGLPKITDLVFAYSRDGFHFSCPDRTPAIASEQWGAYGKKWDVGYVQPLGNVCVVVGDELWFYYGAFGGNHTRLEPDRENNCYYNGMYDNGAMGLAKMRRDGFVGLKGGEIVTRPLSFTGRKLFVNLSGSLKVELLDFKGDRLRNLPAVKGDKTCLAVDDVGSYAGVVVRFRFTLDRDSTLYSFWVSPSEKGESNGYLAGGGPGHGGIRDTAEAARR